MDVPRSPRHSPLGRPPSDDDQLLAEINTTPLIDVMLVLLIMLIITIPIQLHGVNLSLPDGAPPPQPPEVVRIDVDAIGVVHWNGEALADLGGLEARLHRAAAQPTPPALQLRPSARAPYRSVAGVMSAIQREGLTKVALSGAE